MSPSMLMALRECGAGPEERDLVRQPGGCWWRDGAQPPCPVFTAHTINALLRRKLVEAVATVKGKPHRVRITAMGGLERSMAR